MDETTLIILVALGVAAVIAAVLMLRRSWGDFPRDARFTPPPAQQPPPAFAPPDEPDEPFAPFAPPAPPPDEGLVPIVHPLTRQAAAEALRRGQGGRYIVTRNGQLFFDFNQIDDPQQRQQAYDLMNRIQSGGEFDVGEAIRLIRTIIAK